MKHRTGIRFKITALICLSAFVIICIGGGLGYLFGFGLLRETIAETQVKMADLLSDHISAKIDNVINELDIYISNPLLVREIVKANNELEGADEESMRGMFAYMDEQWAIVPEGDVLHSSYTNNWAGAYLEAISRKSGDIAEIFVTNRYGVLVGASGKTSDFYQADEKWWQEAFAGGSGRVFIDRIEYAESVDALSFSFALPVRDEEGGVIGVCKAALDVEEFLSPLEGFTIGRTGHAILVDERGFILFHRGVKPLSLKVCGESEFRELINGTGKWAIIAGPHVHGEEMLLSFALVDNAYLSDSGKNLFAFIDEEAREVFRPVNRLFAQMVGITGILILLLVPVGIISGNIFVKPIKKLHEATEHIEKGELDYPIDIRTDDEVEQLADAFKKMISALKAKQAELSSWSKILEDKVREKTKSLEMSLRESEKTRERMISMLDDNNKIRKDLEAKLKELKETQNMLVQSEKMVSLGKLVSEMAHEVNNPLQAISGRAQLALMDEIPNKELEENLKIIESQCCRARDIIKRLLEFSRPSKGVIQEKDLKDILETTIKLVEHQYSLIGIKILREYSPDELKVKVDTNQIEEVFFNILKNASEAMGHGGSITISTSKEGNKARISFKDTGSGIPEEVMKNIFDPFYTTKKDGTGLGLSVCYGLVKDHGGEMKYESEPGKGTTAIVTLPIQG